ncbi:hypothetical protein NDN08_004822 [Rhodosorus marinus]|uniref:Uncharacterized protein n=1 Tax=Rhodosorus marinus TaxID=101924 RepID=A0AAV8UQZ5_9RHOD|nr:hypothetical protein NDN08_004822 [Rhodosorus marinus]
MELSREDRTMEVDSGEYLLDYGSMETSSTSLERTRRRRRKSGSLLGVNRPITKSDFNAPQLCVNRKVGGMRRNWSFLSLSGGDDISRMDSLSLSGTSSSTWKKTMSPRSERSFDSFSQDLSDEELRALKD